MPATIAETVFITSDREGQLLSNGTGTRQQQIAEALKVGVENYLTTPLTHPENRRPAYPIQPIFAFITFSKY